MNYDYIIVGTSFLVLVVIAVWAALTSEYSEGEV